jgi:PIN domain nuclease of toxin-antitoxin system
MASVWEVGIKFGRRRGRPDDMPISAASLRRLLDGARCELLRIEPAHVLELEQLPPLHGDPFGRLLIAQARAEPLRFVTANKALGAYGAGVEVY